MLNVPSREERIRGYLQLWNGWTLDELVYSKNNSVVYKVHKEGISKKVYGALKMVTLTLDDSENDSDKHKSLKQQLERSKQEIELIGKIKEHKNIVMCYNYDIKPIKDISNNIVGYDILMCMEYLTCFNDVMKHKESFTAQEIIQFAIDVCNALKYLHDNDIIHRDIKPANIFMDEHGNYKLGDFGVSKLMDGSGMAETAVCTKPYGAPEVFQFKPYTIQADIYSLGIVLYRLANDYKYPFSNDVSMVGIETSIANRLKGLKLPTPSLDAPKLNKIILKACAFETKNRYANIDSMLKDLEAIQSNDKERVPLNVDTSTVNKVIESEPKNFTTRLLNKIKSLSKRKANDIKDAPTITQESNFKEFNIERTTEIIIGREQALVEYKSEKNVSIKFDGCVGNILDEAFSHFFELEHLSIEDGAYSLGNKSFYGCHNLKYVKLPNSLEIIGESAFNGCSNLESIELSKGLKTIGDNAFYGCSKLERVEIPNGVTNIGKFAFFLCSRLKEVTVPESVVNIGLYAFPKDNFSSLVIKCGEGTEMYRYCVDNHIKYKLIT